MSVVQAYQGCCSSEGFLGAAKAACAWHLLAPQLGMRGRGMLWESNGECLLHHAKTSRTSAQNQANDVYLDRVLLVAQAAYYLNEER